MIIRAAKEKTTPHAQPTTIEQFRDRIAGGIRPQGKAKKKNWVPRNKHDTRPSRGVKNLQGND